MASIKDPQWTDGLPARVASAIKAEGFTGREELRAALIDGRIALGGVKYGICRIPNIGTLGLSKLYAWVGIASDEDLNAIREGRRHQVAIEKAIVFLESNGYRVEKLNG